MRTSEKETSEILLRISSSDERDCLLLYDGVADEIGANKKKKKISRFSNFKYLSVWNGKSRLSATQNKLMSCQNQESQVPRVGNKNWCVCRPSRTVERKIDCLWCKKVLAIRETILMVYTLNNGGFVRLKNYTKNTQRTSFLSSMKCPTRSGVTYVLLDFINLLFSINIYWF